MLNEIEVEPIGYVTASSFQHKWGTPRQGALVQGATATISIAEKFADAILPALEGVTTVSVVWHAHLNGSSFNPLKSRIKPPKKLDGEKRSVGVFATRGVHRPSSIGLTFCQIESIDGLDITVRGADMIQGSPVLMIKPVFPATITNALEVRCPNWTKVNEVQIGWSPQALASIQGMAALVQNPDEVKSLVEGILSQDPRSVHSIRRHVRPIYEVELYLSNACKIWVIYRHSSEALVDVLLVSQSREVEEHASRSEPWLTRLLEKYPYLADGEE